MWPEVTQALGAGCIIPISAMAKAEIDGLDTISFHYCKGVLIPTISTSYYTHPHGAFPYALIGT